MLPGWRKLRTRFAFTESSNDIYTHQGTHGSGNGVIKEHLLLHGCPVFTFKYSTVQYRHHASIIEYTLQLQLS